MKKIFSLVATFLLILMMMPIKTTEKVYAAQDDGTIVVYGALIQRSETEYSGLYSVRQALYKSSFTLDNDVGPSPISESKLLNASDDLCTASTNFNSWNKVGNILCSGNELKSAVAQFYVDEYSNLTVRLQNDIEISKLDIYYSIAGLTDNDHSSTVYVACTNPSGGYKLCNHAKKISSTVDANHGTWQNDGKYGNLSFTEITMEANGFNKITNDAGVIYNKYNVIEHMPDRVRNMAYSSGAYVIVTMSVTAPDSSDPEGTSRITYHINTMLATKAQFLNVASVRSPSDTTIVSNTNVFTNAAAPDVVDSDYELRAQTLTYVDQVAGLVAMTPGKLIDNEKLEEFIQIFQEYIRPILEIGLGVLLLVRGTILIVGIVKASDEPGVRRDNIKHLVALFVSLVIIMVIVWFFTDIVEAIAELMVGFI